MKKSLTLATTHFSSIGELFASSWTLTKLAMKNLLLLTLIMYAVVIPVVIVFGIIIVGTGIIGLATSSAQSQEAVVRALIALLPALFTLYFAFLAVISAVGVIYKTAMFLAVAKAEEKPSLGALIGPAFKLFIPVFVVGILSGLFIFGGDVAFIIPGIIIGIFVSFAAYEVVFEGKRTVSAINSSVTIIGQNFSEVFVRMIVIYGLALLLSIASLVLQTVFGDSKIMVMFISLAGTIIQTILGWVTLAYMYLVYKEARAMTDFSKPASITWMWVTAIIGWIIFLLFVLGTFVLTKALVKSIGPDYLISEFADELGSRSATDSATLIDGGASVSGEMVNSK